MKYRIIIFTLLFSVFSSITPNSKSYSSNLCDWQSKTEPPPLRGNQGTSSSEEYWFSHLSDIDKNGQKNYFLYSIKNRHPHNYLPAQWEKAQIRFERISPETCAGNDFESFISYKEDHGVFIKYGPRKQYEKNAPLYLKDETKTASIKTDGPVLKSRIIADVQEEFKSSYRIHLEFSTVVKERQFMYSVVNFGTSDQIFSIPELMHAWKRLDNIPKIEVDYKEQWVGIDNAFIVYEKKDAYQIIVPNIPISFEEKLVQVEVFSRERQPIAIGQITVYLPELKE